MMALNSPKRPRRLPVLAAERWLYNKVERNAQRARFCDYRLLSSANRVAKTAPSAAVCGRPENASQRVPAHAHARSRTLLGLTGHRRPDAHRVAPGARDCLSAARSQRWTRGIGKNGISVATAPIEVGEHRRIKATSTPQREEVS
jgi:hypothetical protein